MPAASCCASSSATRTCSSGRSAANTQAGQPVTSVHPQLADARRPRFVATEAAAARRRPTWSSSRCRTASRPPWSAQLPADLPIIDLGADFRLVAADAWTTYYSGRHAGSWPYGLPELPGARAGSIARRASGQPRLSRDRRRDRSGAAAAGRRLVEPQDIVVVAASGTSGAGRSRDGRAARQRGHGRAQSPTRSVAHQHTPEMEHVEHAAANP